MNLCPCLQTILNKFSKRKEDKRSYEGTLEFEEQQFINPNKSDHSYLTDTIQIRDSLPKKPEPEPVIVNIAEQQNDENDENDSDLLNFKMSFETQKEVAQQQKKQQRDIQQLLRQQLEGSSVIKIQQISSLPLSNQKYQQFSQNIMYESFSINLDPLDPYYNILAEKTKKIIGIFDKQGEKIEIGFPNKANLQIQLLDNNKINAYIIKYKLNCSYSFYLSVSRSDKLLQSFNKLIAQTKIIQSFKSNLTLNTLKFHKIGSFEARDCFYVKYQNGGNRQHWQIYLNSQKGVGGANYKTCEIFCIKNIRQKSESQLIIHQYLQCDLETTSLSSILPKITNELKNYLNAFQDHIQQNYEQESA